MKRQAFIYCLVVLLVSLTGTIALFGKDKNNGEKQQRRRLSQSSMSEQDHDAATGTVKPVLTEEQKAANTCDGQMAQSLVKANEEMLEARRERDEAVAAKKDAIAKAAVLETTTERISHQMQDMEQSHTNEILDLGKKIREIEADRDSQLEQKDKAHAVAIEDLTHAKDAVIAELNDIIQKGREVVEAEYRVQIEELTTSHANEVAAFRAQIDELKTAHANEIASLKAEHETQIANREQQMKDQAAEAERVLQTTKDEAKKFMITQVNAVKDEMTQLQQQHEAKESQSQETINKMDDMYKELMRKKNSLEKKVEHLEDEIAMWRENHAGRRYINFTDIYIDTVYVASNVAELAWNTSEEIAEKLSVNAEILYEEYQELSAEAKEKFDKFYAEKHAIYWPKVEPHYNKHIVPVVIKKNEVMKELKAFYAKEIEPKQKELEKAYNEKHKKVVGIYGKQCKEAVKSGRELDIPHFDVVEKYASMSCSQPDKSVTYIRNTILFLFVYFFRRIIFAPFFWVLGLVWYILVTITPLRFFFGRKKSPFAEDAKENGTSDPNKIRVKKKGKVKGKVQAQ